MCKAREDFDKYQEWMPGNAPGELRKTEASGGLAEGKQFKEV